MRKARFEVPEGAMGGFADELKEHDLTNSINGTTKSGDTVVEVMYSRDESESVDALEERLEFIIENLSDDDQDDDDND